MKRYILCVIMITLLILGTARAVNDAMWMGLKYSVAVRYFPGSEKGFDPPRPQSAQMPEYPIAQMQMGVSGNAIISFVVTDVGKVESIEVEQSLVPEFGAVAKRCVAEWRFYPALNREKQLAVRSKMRCVFEFRATEEGQNESH